MGVESELLAALESELLAALERQTYYSEIATTLAVAWVVMAVSLLPMVVTVILVGLRSMIWVVMHGNVKDICNTGAGFWVALWQLIRWGTPKVSAYAFVPLLIVTIGFNQF